MERISIGPGAQDSPISGTDAKRSDDEGSGFGEHSTLEALGKECVQIVKIGGHVKVTFPVLGDVERRAVSIVISAKEMWRTLDAPFHTLMPIRENRLFVCRIRSVDPVSSGNFRENVLARNIEALLEQRIT